MITINVCGKIFKTDLETITKSELFKNMIDDVGAPTEEIFINRSPALFEHVLAYLIDQQYPFPLKYEAELKYYLIDYDRAKLYDEEASLKAKIKNLEGKINSINFGFGMRGACDGKDGCSSNNKNYRKNCCGSDSSSSCDSNSSDSCGSYRSCGSRKSCGPGKPRRC